MEASPWSQVLAAIKGKMAPAREGAICLTTQHLRGHAVILMQDSKPEPVGRGPKKEVGFRVEKG